MGQRPKHLTLENASRFKHHSVVGAYQFRLPYPPELFTQLVDLLKDKPLVVLDLGCGTGDIARGLAPLVDRVDALDMSEAMIAQGKISPGGDHPHIQWIVGTAEAAVLQPPYGLVTAGESFHWMDWEVVFDRLRQVLEPEGFLALIDRGELSTPWQDSLGKLAAQFSTIQNFEHFDLIETLEKRGLFQKQGEKYTSPVTSMQSVDDYIESFFSRAGFSSEFMTVENQAAFRAEIRKLTAPYTQDGKIKLQSQAHIVWGRPA